jgi:hypothetical protein
MHKKLSLFAFMILIAFRVIGQTDTTVRITRDTIFIEAQDTTLIQSYAKRYNPRKALLIAAVLPGAGQVYNKKYWKLPLVYGGIYLIYDGMDHYNNLYSKYKGYLYENLTINSTGTTQHPGTKLTTDQLRRIVDRARRERDYMIILMGGMYLLQIIDAHVDAHLKEFDLNPNLRVSVEPTLSQDALIGRQTGMALIFRF